MLWLALGRARSLKVVAILGLIGAIGLIVVALWRHSLWIGLISVYVVMNCWVGFQQAQILSRSATSPPASVGNEEYGEVTDPEIRSRVRVRHSAKIAALESLGFQRLTYRLEILPPYSAISAFPLIPVMYTKEVLVFQKPLRLGIANILLTHPSPSSMAVIIGLGVKFYSVFSDGTLLISSSFRSAFAPRPNSRIIKNPHCQTVQETWQAHKQKVAELETQDLTVRGLSSFADYLEIEEIKVGMVAD